MVDWLTDPTIWASFITLTAMEVVLGIDNIVFLSVIVARLPLNIRDRARQIGLALALIFRVAMLFGITWLIGLTDALFEIAGEEISWRDIILISGGLFLLAKGTHEIHQSVESEDEEEEEGSSGQISSAFAMVILQIAVIDLVFSIDSIITAIGMAQHIEVMVAAVTISIVIMYVAANSVSAFIDAHPTTKMLALSFLLLIGVALVADGIGLHIPRGYIYFAMAFAASVEVVNVMASKRRKRRRANDRARIS